MARTPAVGAPLAGKPFKDQCAEHLGTGAYAPLEAPAIDLHQLIFGEWDVGTPHRLVVRAESSRTPLLMRRGSLPS
jgi:hypothetical protein